jgi:hypothetical protein
MNKKKLGILFKILLILTTIIIVSVLLVKRFLYFKPSSNSRKTCRVYKIFRIKHLYGWVYDENPTDKIVIFCIDRTGNVSFYEKEFMDIIKLGYNVLSFDYSGFGKSGGVPNERRIFEDVSLVVQDTLTKYNPENIIIIGKGMGGVAAAYGARRHKLNKLVLDRPLLSIKDIFPAAISSVFRFLFREFDLQTYLNGYFGKSLLLFDRETQQKYEKILNIVSEKSLIEKNNPYKKIINF